MSNTERTHLYPQTPRVKRAPLLCNREKCSRPPTGKDNKLWFPIVLCSFTRGYLLLVPAKKNSKKERKRQNQSVGSQKMLKLHGPMVLVDDQTSENASPRFDITKQIQTLGISQFLMMKSWFSFFLFSWGFCLE